jgi:hypothetical protein
MSLSPGKLPPSRRPEAIRPGRRPDAGIARGPGIAVAGVVAAIVFAIGQQLFPIRPRQEPAPPAPLPTPPPPAVAPPTLDAAPAAVAPAADAGAAGTDADKSPTAEKQDEASADKPAPEKPTPDKSDAEDAPAGAAAERKPIDKQRQADRELAREAWRRNRPDISVIGTKTSVMVPIRGSIKGAEFKILKKTRTIVVTLPKAVSMITLPVYNLKHPSFKKLWIDQDEANAQPKDGSKLRLVLSDTFNPQVEITDDFVRITIRRPAHAGDDAPAEKQRGSRAEKRARPEKSDEATDEAAPSEKAPEKASE